MPKLLKLKNKPFWIVAAIILIIGVAFYKQRSTEGFATMLNVVGFLWYGKIKDLDDGFFTTGATGLVKVLDGSDGKEIWKNGDSRPTSSDKKYYVLISNSTVNNMTYDNIKDGEKKAKDSPSKEFKNGFVCTVVLKDNNYRDKDDNKIIDAWTHILGMNLLKTTLYWILGGVGALVFLIIIFMMMRNSGGGNSNSSLNKNYNS
jgi:hypothetical protein